MWIATWNTVAAYDMNPALEVLTMSLMSEENGCHVNMVFCLVEYSFIMVDKTATATEVKPKLY